jgi:hypothetical protein
MSLRTDTAATVAETEKLQVIGWGRARSEPNLNEREQVRDVKQGK